MIRRGVAYVVGYAIRCACECGCAVRFRVDGQGDAYADERRAFDDALAAAGWQLGQDDEGSPRWRCSHCAAGAADEWHCCSASSTLRDAVDGLVLAAGDGS